MPGATFITTPRLDLRTVEDEDVEFLRTGVNHPDVRRYISVYREPRSAPAVREDLLATERDNDGVSLLVVPRDGEFADEPVGSVQLFPIQTDDGYANFGVWFLPAAWGNGFALEAGAHLIEHGFTSHRLHRISATVMAPNGAAATLCERLGFVHEGTARESQYADGTYVDVERYGLLDGEWEGPDAVLSSGDG